MRVISSSSIFRKAYAVISPVAFCTLASLIRCVLNKLPNWSARWFFDHFFSPICVIFRFIVNLNQIK